MSLMPVAALGHRYSVSVRVVDSIVRVACIDHRTSYGWRGRILNKLGVEQLRWVNWPAHKQRQGQEWRSIV